MPWSEHWITLVIFHFPREDGHPSRNDLYTRARMFQWVFGLQICSSWQVAKVPKRSPSIFGEITLWPWSRQHAARGGQLMPGTLLICQGAVGHSSSLGVQVIFFTVPALESLEVTTRDTRHVGHAMPRQGQR